MVLLSARYPVIADGRRCCSVLKLCAGCVQYSCSSGYVTMLGGGADEMKLDHDNDSGCGDDSASSNGSSSSSGGAGGTVSDAVTTASAVISSARPTDTSSRDVGKYHQLVLLRELTTR